jgi:pyroglutamyl-peptidase
MQQRVHRAGEARSVPWPAGRRPTVLLTGFGPFPAVPSNATTELVPRLAEAVARTFRSHRVETAILPTEWTAGPEMAVDLAERHAPVVTVHFGVSSRARGFEIETVGRNQRDAAPDACGETPLAGPVLEDAPTELASQVPAARIVARLRRLGIPAHLSRDAGGYLCNAVLYHSLFRARVLGSSGAVGFVHVPDALAAGVRRRYRVLRSPLDWEQALTGAVEIVATCLGSRERVPVPALGSRGAPGRGSA